MLGHIFFDPRFGLFFAFSFLLNFLTATPWHDEDYFDVDSKSL